MPKSFINTGDANGTIVVPTSGDVVLDGKLYEDGNEIKNWSHSDLSSGADFAIETPHSYQVIVNAIFKGEGQAEVTCSVGSRTKIEPLAGDADDNGIDLEVAQFDIYS